MSNAIWYIILIAYYLCGCDGVLKHNSIASLSVFIIASRSRAPKHNIYNYIFMFGIEHILDGSFHFHSLASPHEW